MIWDFVWRLVLAALFGTIIGLDREYREKEAGFRTHFLVSLGSALMMIVSQYGFSEILTHDGVSLDPSRIAAQVVSGIGFIGAGTIIFNHQIVRGLTTAASLWATAGIGLTAGAGMSWLALAATILTLVALEGLSLVFRSLGSRRRPPGTWGGDRRYRRHPALQGGEADGAGDRAGVPLCGGHGKSDAGGLRRGGRHGAFQRRQRTGN